MIKIQIFALVTIYVDSLKNMRNCYKTSVPTVNVLRSVIDVSTNISVFNIIYFICYSVRGLLLWSLSKQLKILLQNRSLFFILIPNVLKVFCYQLILKHVTKMTKIYMYQVLSQLLFNRITRLFVQVICVYFKSAQVEK